MTAPEQEWQPGDPLHTDNGCGNIPTVNWTAAERAQARTEGDPPPWWTPDPEHSQIGLASSRSCAPCGVRWRGDAPCWMCGGEDIP